MDNIELFNYSVENDDEILNFLSPEGVIVINKNETEEPTELIVANKKLIEYITTYKILSEKKDESSNIAKVGIVRDIIDLIENVDLINYTAFCVYFQVLSYSYNSYMKQCKKMSEEEKISIWP